MMEAVLTCSALTKEMLLAPQGSSEGFVNCRPTGVLRVVLHVLNAVSYTHLDVYKRQILPRSKSWSCTKKFMPPCGPAAFFWRRTTSPAARKRRLRCV